MCGLTGFVLHDRSARADEDLLVRIRDTMVHRGPDDGGTFVRGGAALGFRRLSIIDLEGGHQPLTNETEDVFLVMNGEVYNFRELRSGLEERGHRFRTGSDAEVLVHLYEEKGAALVDDLVGMYAFCLLDLRGGAPKVLLGRDRLGIKPLYWVETTRGLAFASEVKALAELGWTPRNLRSEALLDYLIQGYVGGPEAGLGRRAPSRALRRSHLGSGRSGTRGTHLGPGDRRPARSRIGRRDPRAARPRRLRPPDRRRAPGRVPVRRNRLDRRRFVHGEILGRTTVGVLGRIPRALTRRARGRNRHRPTLGEPTSARKSLDPDPTLVTDVLPWFYDEPLADPSTLPTYLVSKMAREHVDGGPVR